MRIERKKEIKTTNPPLMITDTFYRFYLLGVHDLTQCTSAPDLTPTNQSPVLVNSPTQSNLLALLTARWCCQCDRDITTLYRCDPTTSLTRSNVDEQGLTNDKLANLGLFAVVCLDTKQSTEQEDLCSDFDVDGWALVNRRHDHTEQSVGTTESRVNEGTDTDKTTGNGKLEVVLLGVEGDDTRSQRSASADTVGVPGNKTRSDLDFLANLEDTLQDTTTSDTTLQLVDTGTRLVNIKRSDNDHTGVGTKVIVGRGNVADSGDDGVNVEFELGGDRDDGGETSGSTCVDN